MDLISYMYNKDDYSNAEPDEIVAGFRGIIYKIKKSWAKQKNNYENSKEFSKGKAGIAAGEALQLVRLIFKNVDPAINNKPLDEKTIKFLFSKGEEARAIKLKFKDTEIKKDKLVPEIIASLNEVSKLKSISLGLSNMLNLKIDCFGALPKSFQIKIKDRDLLINSYLIARPQGTSVNYEFINYIIKLKPNTHEVKDMPTWLTNKFKERKDIRFIKMLNDLNITGEIRKAFFPQVKNESLKFRGSTVLKSTLEKEGVNVKALIAKLEEVDLYNNKN